MVKTIRYFDEENDDIDELADIFRSVEIEKSNISKVPRKYWKHIFKRFPLLDFNFRDLSPEMFKMAIEINDNNINQLCNFISANKDNINKFPHELRSLLTPIIESCPGNIPPIDYIPDDILSFTLSEYFIATNKASIQRIPHRFRSFNENPRQAFRLYFRALQVSNWSDPSILEFLFSELTSTSSKVTELCRITLKNCGMCLKSIPEKYRTKELCAIALNNNGFALQYVPSKYEQSLYQIALKNNPLSLQYVNDKYKKFDVCYGVVNRNGYAIIYVPSKYIPMYEYMLVRLAIKNVSNDKICEVYNYIQSLSVILDSPRFFLTLYKLNKNISKCVKFNKILNLQKSTITPKLKEDTLDNFVHNYNSYISLVDKNQINLSEIPEKYRTVELCLLYFHCNTLQINQEISFIPQDVLNTFLIQSIETCLLSFEGISNIVTYEVCLSLLTNPIPSKGSPLSSFDIYVYYLKNIPEKFQLEALYYDAIKVNGKRFNKSFIEYIPSHILTRNFYMKIVKNNLVPLNYIPQPFDYQLCVEAVKIDGMNLEYVPPTFRKSEIYKYAVNNNGLSLQFISDLYKTPELCSDAVKNNGLSLEYVPEIFIIRNPTLCNQAISQNLGSFEFVPDEFKTPEMCDIVVNNGNGIYLEFVPEIYKSYELCENAVINNGMALEFVPDEYRTDELLLHAVLNNGLSLQFITIITPDLCISAIYQNPQSLQFVPDEYKTPELCKYAVVHNGISLEFVPDEYKTRELCMEAIIINGMSIKYVPVKYLDAELCIIALNNRKYDLQEIIKYVPSEILNDQDFVLEYEDFINEEYKSE